MSLREYETWIMRYEVVYVWAIYDASDLGTQLEDMQTMEAV